MLATNRLFDVRPDFALADQTYQGTADSVPTSHRSLRLASSKRRSYFSHFGFSELGLRVQFSARRNADSHRSAHMLPCASLSGMVNGRLGYAKPASQGRARCADVGSYVLHQLVIQPGFVMTTTAMVYLLGTNGARRFSVDQALPDSMYTASAHAESIGPHFLADLASTQPDRFHLPAGQPPARTVATQDSVAVQIIVGPSGVFEVVKPVVVANAVLVIHIHSSRRRPHEGSHDHAMREHAFALVPWTGKADGLIPVDGALPDHLCDSPLAAHDVAGFARHVLPDFCVHEHILPERRAA